MIIPSSPFSSLSFPFPFSLASWKVHFSQRWMKHMAFTVKQWRQGVCQQPGRQGHTPRTQRQKRLFSHLLCPCLCSPACLQNPGRTVPLPRRTQAGQLGQGSCEIVLWIRREMPSDFCVKKYPRLAVWGKWLWRQRQVFGRQSAQMHRSDTRHGEDRLIRDKPFETENIMWRETDCIDYHHSL